MNKQIIKSLNQINELVDQEDRFKRYMRLYEAERNYQLDRRTLMRIAQYAEALYKINSIILIDMDSQGSGTASLGYDEPDEMENTLADVFAKYIEDEDIEPDYGILHTDELFDLMPGNIERNLY